MQDKITKILKQASIFTTDPDKDWRRIFVGLIVITVSVSVWSFFFYRQVNQDIQVSETKRPKNAGAVVAAYGEYLGVQTNNVAEYSALLSALTKAKELGATEVDCILDSELVVKQMRREYKVKEPTLQKLYLKIYNLTTQFKKVTFTHTLRAGNKEADAEVNKVLDQPR
jgi:ribonuclease HI